MTNIEPIRAAAVASGIVVNVEMILLGFERDGVIYVPSETAGIGDRYEGDEFVRPEIEPTVLTPADIDAERDRRLIAGTTFANHLFQTDQLDRERIDRSRISAIAAIIGGAQKGDLRWHGQPVDFFWIAADNARVAMDAQTMVAFGNAVAAREGLLIITGNDLKRRLEAGEEIGDIGSDALWPA